MTLPSSSTAAKSFQRHALIGSTDTDTLVSSVAVPLSAQTLRMPSLSRDVLFGEHFQVALEKHIAGAAAPAGIVTCRYTGDTGRFIFESPTRRLAAEPFQVTSLFGVAPVEWATHEDRFHTFFLNVTMLHATAQPIAPAHGLLDSTDAALGAFRLVEAKFAKAVTLATDEWFEDGIESAFSRALSILVHIYGDAAIAAVETFLESPSKNIEVAVEATQRLGEFDHPASSRYRRTLLEKLLTRGSSPRLRHAAAAGLAAMDDPSSLASLVEALDRESNPRLRHFLQLVVDQLERTRACPSS